MGFVRRRRLVGRFLDGRFHFVPLALNSVRKNLKPIHFGKGTSYNGKSSSKENLSLQRRLDTIIALRPSDAAEQLLMINSGIFR
jgi:hypothetical protein